MAAPPGGDGDRSREAQRIDAEMPVEAAILDGDEGLRRIGRQLAERDGAPAGLAAIRQQAAVGGEDRDIRCSFRHGELVDRRQLGEIISDEPGESDATPDAKRQAPDEQPPEE